MSHLTQLISENVFLMTSASKCEQAFVVDRYLPAILPLERAEWDLPTHEHFLQIFESSIITAFSKDIAELIFGGNFDQLNFARN
jgi:hypothetical protein